MKDYKKKLIIKIVLSVVCLFVLMFVAFLLKDAFTPKYDGEIQFIFVDYEGNIIIEEKLEYKKEQTLVEIFQENYENVIVENGMVMSFEDYNTPADGSNFILIYVNDEMSMVGINDIEFENGTKISFVITDEFPY